MLVPILFRGHAGDAFEEMVERGRFGKTELIRYLLNGAFLLRIEKQFGLRHYILLYPFSGRNTVRGIPENTCEMARRDMQQVGIVFHLP